jgi:putative ABC transport system ATP-binding protein
VTAETPVLDVSGLHRFFRRGGEEVAALRDVSFVVAAGELVAVRGPSGCGKSTLLGLLAGLDRPDAGEVRLDGLTFNHRGAADPVEARRAGIGLLPQSGGLIEHLRVRDNVRIAARIRGVRADAEQLLGSVGLANRQHAWPSELSGAEVSSVEERTLLRLLRDNRPSAGATIVVTHSDVVAAAADRVLDMRVGQLLPRRVAVESMA